MFHSRAIRLPLLLLAVSGFLYGCGGSGGGSETQVPTAPPIKEAQDARYQLLLLDAVDGTRIEDPLQVTFTSNAELTAADGSLLAGKTVTVNDGIVALNAAFTATAREFSVQIADVSDNGWVASGRRVVGRDGLTGDQLIEIKMVNTSAAARVNASPKPIAMAVQTVSVSATGALAAPVAQETQPKTVTNSEGVEEKMGVARMDIPAGTRGTTATGQPAAAGALTVSTTYFSNANADSMSAFPGGFAANVEVPAANAAVLNGASADAGTFITGGFAQFNITDSAGNPITQFDKPITVGIDLPKTSRDLDGRLLTVGSEYPVWSYDEANGKWVFERLGIVREKSPVDPDNYTVEFATTHLSSWNLDFYGSTCTAQINIVGRPAGDARPLTVEVVGIRGTRFSYTNTATDSSISLARVPRSTANIVIKDNGVVVGRTSRPLCGGAINVSVSLRPVPAGTVTVTTRETCADGTQARPLPTYVNVFAGSVVYSGYSTTSGTVATKSFASVRTGTVQVRAYNPHAKQYVTQNATVTNGTTVTSAFTFTMPCRPVTGGSSTAQ